jgi:hypothetical protein
LEARGTSFTPLTVTVTVPGLLVSPCRSVARKPKLTWRVWPAARFWKPAPGLNVNVPLPLLTTLPSLGEVRIV